MLGSLWPACIAALALAVRVRAVYDAGDWDSINDNLASDLAPIIALFGENATKQFLSESTSFLDTILFAVGPLGIITAVVSIIRIYGPSSLKSFIGKSQESEGVAEAELCSSTSDDVCELFSRGGIVRAFGQPRLLEFLFSPPKDAAAYYPDASTVVGAGGVSVVDRAAHCGISLTRDVFDMRNFDHSSGASLIRRRRFFAGGGRGSMSPSRLPSGLGMEAFVWTSNYWREVTRDEIVLSQSAFGGRLANYIGVAPNPNLSLNIGIRRAPKWVLFLAATFGVLLQASFFGYAAWATYFHPDFYGPGKGPTTWVFAVTVVGTALLVLGMGLCARLIDRKSVERSFTAKSSSSGGHGSRGRIFWLQAGGQKIGDEAFGPFACSEQARQYVTSWKVKGPDRPPLMFWLAMACSLPGWVLQFVGLRGLTGTISLYQLVITLVMSGVRALVRGNRLSTTSNRLREYGTWIEGKELDWQAQTLSERCCEIRVFIPIHKQIGGTFQSVPNSTWLLFPFACPDDASSDDNSSNGPEVPPLGADIDYLRSPRTAQLAGFRLSSAGDTRREDDAVVGLANAAVRWMMLKECPNGLPNEKAKIMRLRARLALLADKPYQTAEGAWDSEIRDTATRLQAALEQAAQHVFSNMELFPQWRDVRALSWSCHVSQKGGGAVPVCFHMLRNNGVWAVDRSYLEAALGLWHWHVMIGPTISSKSKNLLVSTEGLDRLVSALKLWVSQTYEVCVERIKHSRPECPVVRPWSPPRGPSEPEKDIETLSPVKTSPGAFSVPVAILLENIGTGRVRLPTEELRRVYIASKSSLPQQLAQDMFAVFISKIVEIVEPLKQVARRKPGFAAAATGPSTTDFQGLSTPYLGLANSDVEALANTLVANDLASREDALMSIVPSLLWADKLPPLDDVMEALLGSARSLRRGGRLKESEELLNSLFNLGLDRYQGDVLLNLGEVYRARLRADVGGKTLSSGSVLDGSADTLDVSHAPERLSLGARIQIVEEGILTMRKRAKMAGTGRFAMAYSGDCWQAYLAYQAVLDCFMKREAEGETAAVRPALQLAEWEEISGEKKFREKRALTLADEFNLVGSTSAVLLRVLRFAIEQNVPGLIDDLKTANANLVNLWWSEDVPQTAVFWIARPKVRRETITAVLDWPGIILDTSEPRTLQTPLMQAAELDTDDFLSLALRRGASWTVRNTKGETALAIAARSGRGQAVQRLLDAGACKDRDMMVTALYDAAQARQKDVVRQLVEKGADPNDHVQGKEFSNILEATITRDDAEMAKLLIQLGAKVNVQTRNRSPLGAAIARNDIDLVRYLVLECKADASMLLPDAQYGSALSLAASLASRRGPEYFDTLQFLVEEGHADVNQEVAYDGNFGSALVAAAAYVRGHDGDKYILATVTFLIEKLGADIHQVLSHGKYGTALAAAAANPAAAVVRFLVGKGADVNRQLAHGEYGTALIATAGALPMTEMDLWSPYPKQHRERLEIVQFLVEECGADVNAQSGHGPGTALIAAARWHARDEIVEYLISRGQADIDTEVLNGDDAQTNALAALVSRAARPRLVRLLVGDHPQRARTLLRGANTYGSILALAAVAPHRTVVDGTDMLASRMAPKKELGGYAAENLRFLVDKCRAGDVNAVLLEGLHGSALTAAICRGPASAIQTLMEAGGGGGGGAEAVDMVLAVGDFASPLAAAAYLGRPWCVRMLLARGAQPNRVLLRTVFRTALEAAQRSRNLDGMHVVGTERRRLEAHHAELARYLWDFDPFELAISVEGSQRVGDERSRRRIRSEVIAILQQAGARHVDEAELSEAQRISRVKTRIMEWAEIEPTREDVDAAVDELASSGLAGHVEEKGGEKEEGRGVRPKFSWTELDTLRKQYLETSENDMRLW